MEDPEGGGWKPYERWYITRGWRVVNSGPGTNGAPEGERNLVELHVDVSETIVRHEELVLSRSDEVSVVLPRACKTRLSTVVFRCAGSAPLELWLGSHSATLICVAYYLQDDTE